MDAFAHALLVLSGMVLTIIVLDAGVRTFVVPRATVVLLTSLTFQAVRAVLQPFAPARRGYEAEDRVYALYAPLALLALPAISLVLIFFAYTLVFAGLGHHAWRAAIMTSGSSLLTLGFEHPGDLPSVFAAFTEAAIGLALLALVIAYLPTIYNAFSRREIAVTDLASRAGTPPTAGELVVRAHRTGFLSDLDPFWDQWNAWFTEVRETHTTYGALTFFRSPNPHRNWVIAAGAVLDSAAVRLAVLDMPWTPNAALCIRSGYLTLREVAGFFGFDYDPDPVADGPISVSRDEFDEMCTQLAAAGVPIKQDRDQAWRDFNGWRVNYDSVLLALAGFVRAPYAPWISDRSPRTALKRYSWGRRRRVIMRRAASAGRTPR